MGYFDVHVLDAALSQTGAKTSMLDPGSTFFSTLTREEQQWLKAHPLIRLGFSVDRPPFEFIDAQGGRIGIVADYLDLIQKRLHITFERQKKADGSALTWAEIQDAARAKQLDVIASLVRSDERDGYLNFTRSYMDFPWVFIADRKTKHSGKITEFYGQKVSVVGSYSIAARLPLLYPGLDIVKVDNQMQGLLSVARGETAIFINNAAQAAYQIKRASLSQLEIAGILPEIDSDLHMGVRKDWRLLAGVLDKALASLTPRETAAIHNNWISLDFDKGIDWKKILTLLIPAMLVVLIVMAVILVANRRLQKEVHIRQQAEDALRESQAHSRHLLESVGGGVIDVDTRGMLRFANGNALAMLGYCAKDLEGKPLHSLIHHTNKDGAACLPAQCPLYQTYAKEKKSHVSSDIFWKKDGTPLPVEYMANPIYKSQIFIGAVVSFLDITERLKDEQKIRQSREHLNFTLHAVEAFFWQIDCRDNTMSYNDFSFFDDYEYGREDIPRNFDDYLSKVHPDDRERIKNAFERHLQGDIDVINEDCRIQVKENFKWIWLNILGRIIERDSQGTALKMAGMAQNITERKELFEEIKESREMLRIISEHTHDWQVWWDINDRLVWMNRAVERLTGYTVEECMAMKDYPWRLIDERDWDYFREKTRKTLQGNGRQECVLRIHRKDGLRVFVSAAYEPVLNKSGQIMGLVSVAKDITEQKEAERGLRLMLRVFEDGADPIIITDLEGIILELNEEAVSTYGYSREELIGKEIWVLVSKEADLREKALFRRCINGEILKNIEGERIRKDGSRIPHLFTFSLLKNDEGKPLGIASMAKDITELKQAEKELKDYRDHLEDLVRERTCDLEEAKLVAEEATKAKSDFLANMSHEIRTPLNAIIGFAHLALRTGLDAVQCDYINKIQNGSKALLGVINDILDFSKIEAGKLGIESIEFSLEDVLETVTDLVGIKAQEKGLEVVYNIDPSIPSLLIGDPVRLGQILLNLTSNAVKFTMTGEIVLGCALSGNGGDDAHLKFYVQDSGVGLTREQQDRLFQSFSQADSSTTRKHGGTGLGLFISKSLVEMMNGRIWVESEYGKGSTFFFTVRLKRVDSDTIASRLHYANIQHKKMLVVDDNYISRTVLAKMLDAMSFKVIQAESAEAGFVELETAVRSREPFDLVFMDWHMPGMDGLRAAEKIKNSTQENIPSIIMVSAYAREEVMQQAQRIGLDGYLIKPVSPSLLADSIISALKGHVFTRSVRRRINEILPDVGDIQGAKLLVAEDNEVNQQVARGILENNGFVVDMVDNGRLAVAAVENNRYDAVLMDINMPDMDGYGASREIRKNPQLQDLPIIAMTANAMTGDREKALAAGMNDHVAKPIDVRSLLDVLQKWVRPAGKDILPASGQGMSAANKKTDFGCACASIGCLPGIDIEDGLGRLDGDCELYRELLRKFAESQADTADNIAQALERSDMDLARRLVHTIKGVSGNIGAKSLFGAATLLDAAVKEEDLHDALAHLPDFTARLGEVIQGVNAMQQDPATASSTSGAQAGHCENLRPLLMKLQALLEDDDTEAGSVVRQLKDEIGASTSGGLLDELSRKISKYDFDEAQEVLNAFCRHSGIEL
ncbi:PAS domain S-box protein [uncultured Desulfobacter sp.]|uniref:PAS domain S-box protein n=1 Tax=uncultured Desulfobacter sp. TaxID=240139 RepID=UPI002AAC1302|nr:PAS domain S-box protein [uncultured Desulfobacter sp.]